VTNFFLQIVYSNLYISCQASFLNNICIKIKQGGFPLQKIRKCQQKKLIIRQQPMIYWMFYNTASNVISVKLFWDCSLHDFVKLYKLYFSRTYIPSFQNCGGHNAGCMQVLGDSVLLRQLPSCRFVHLFLHLVMVIIPCF